ncbi:MAG: cytochrome c oxidase assembly protein [Acetobacteraceae bacterium]|jgi:putative membrane protein
MPPLHAAYPPRVDQTLRAEPAVMSAPGFSRDDAIGLAATFVIGGALSWLCEHHPTELPVWAPWDFSWVEFLSTTLGLWWYARGAAQTHPSAWRQASFLVGVVAIYSVLQSRFDYMAQHEFFLNRVQHIFMHHLGPFLIALAWPGETLKWGMPVPFRRLVETRALVRTVRFVQQPFLAGILFVGLIYLFLIPAVHFRAMIDPHLYAIMNWSMVIDGILFWCLVLDPRPQPPARVSYATRLVLPFAVMFPQIAMGSYIAFSPGGLYPYYDLCGRLFPSITAAYDQHVGGIVVWIPAGMMSAVGFMTVLNAMRVHEDSLGDDTPEDDAADGTRIVIHSSAWTGR